MIPVSFTYHIPTFLFLVNMCNRANSASNAQQPAQTNTTTDITVQTNRIV